MFCKSSRDLEECSGNQRWWEIPKSDLEIKDGGDLGASSGNQRQWTFGRMFWKSKMADVWENALEIKYGGHLGEWF